MPCFMELFNTQLNESDKIITDLVGSVLFSREIRFKKLKFITEFNGWLKQS